MLDTGAAVKGLVFQKSAPDISVRYVWKLNILFVLFAKKHQMLF